MVKINKDLKDTSTCKLYDPKGKLIGEIETYIQYLDVRRQIRESKLKGYMIEYKEELYRIDETGRPEETFPKDFFNLTIDLLGKLF